MRCRRLLVACLMAGALPLVAEAQLPMQATVRGPRSLQLSDGEPISFFMELSRELDLNDEQRTKLIEIRRRLRHDNALLVKALDSLARVSGVELGDRQRITSDDLRAMERFRIIAAPVTDSIKVNNDAARSEARLLLSEMQRSKMDSIVTASRTRDPRRPGQ